MKVIAETGKTSCVSSPQWACRYCTRRMPGICVSRDDDVIAPQVDLVTEIANTVSRLTYNYGPMWCAMPGAARTSVPRYTNRWR